MNFNQVNFGGRLTRDPEMKFLPSQMAVCNFGLVSNRKFKAQGGGELRDEATFVEVVAFGKQAEVINQHLTKGSELFVSGRLKYEQWDDKSTGAKRSALKIMLENFQFIGSKRDGDGQDSPRSQVAAKKSSAGNEYPSERVIDDDSIPF